MHWHEWEIPEGHKHLKVLKSHSIRLMMACVYFVYERVVGGARKWNLASKFLFSSVLGFSSSWIAVQWSSAFGVVWCLLHDASVSCGAYGLQCPVVQNGCSFVQLDVIRYWVGFSWLQCSMIWCLVSPLMGTLLHCLRLQSSFLVAGAVRLACRWWFSGVRFDFFDCRVFGIMFWCRVV